MLRRCWCQVLRRYFLLQEKEVTVKLSMGIIQSNPKRNYLCRRTYDVFNSKRMSKYYLRCGFVERKIKLNSSRSPFIAAVVTSKFLAKFFHRHKFQRPPNCRREKFSQMRWTHRTLTSNVSASTVGFAAPQQEGYKCHSLPGSVGELSGDKL